MEFFGLKLGLDLGMRAAHEILKGKVSIEKQLK